MERRLRSWWPRRLLGIVLGALGLAIALFVAYWLFLTFVAAALGPMDPEEALVPPAVVSLAAVLLAATGYYLTRPDQGWLRVAFVGALVSTSAVCLFASWQAALVVGEPLYRASRTVTLSARWKEHDQLPDRIVIQTAGSDPYWWTLKEQPGLLDHLRSLGDVPVDLKIRLLSDRQGQVTRIFLEAIAGVQLRRQYIVGHFFSEFR